MLPYRNKFLSDIKIFIFILLDQNWFFFYLEEIYELYRVLYNDTIESTPNGLALIIVS